MTADFVPPSCLKWLFIQPPRDYFSRVNQDDYQDGDRPPVQRLKRLDRLFISHPLYFVTACTEGRKSILANPTIHEAFRIFCHRGLERGVFVGNYVLMPDHFHLFVAFGEEYELSLIKNRVNRQSQTDATESGPVAAVCDRRPPDFHITPLSDWMKSLKNSLSKTLRGLNIPAPHWQKGFFDHVMRSEESYSQKWHYVANNPIRAKLIAHPKDWPYQGEIYPLQARGHV